MTKHTSDSRKREAARIYQRAWRIANPDRSRSYSAAWRRKNPEKYCTSKANWRTTHRERIRVAKKIAYIRYRERHLAACKRWRAMHPEARAAYGARRRAEEQKASGSGVTAAQWKQVLYDALGLCAYCNKNTEQLTMDHIEPLALDGSHDKTNVTAACKSCNSSKGTARVVVWLARQSPHLFRFAALSSTGGERGNLAVAR